MPWFTVCGKILVKSESSFVKSVNAQHVGDDRGRTLVEFVPDVKYIFKRCTRIKAI